jgi:hypothetical protein
VAGCIRLIVRSLQKSLHHITASGLRPRNGEIDMRLTEEQSRALLAKRGAYVTEVCDKCGKILGPIRFTRCGQAGEWCSKRCRDGFERKPGTCLGCGVPLNGKRKGAVFCSDVSEALPRRGSANYRGNAHRKISTYGRNFSLALWR